MGESVCFCFVKNIYLVFFFFSPNPDFLRGPAVSERDPDSNEILCKSGREGEGEAEGEHVMWRRLNVGYVLN